jgi:hypothetical protein
VLSIKPYNGPAGTDARWIAPQVYRPAAANAMLDRVVRDRVNHL